MEYSHIIAFISGFVFYHIFMLYLANRMPDGSTSVQSTRGNGTDEKEPVGEEVVAVLSNEEETETIES